MSALRFRFDHGPLDTAAAREALADPTCGGYASFEGWVRDHNEGHDVERLEYEAFETLGVREGERIVAEACAKFGIDNALCLHRLGSLAIGELAVWVGVSAPHRDEAFRACRYIIDEVKHRVPIWKKEFYADGDSGWVNCERCAAPVTSDDAQAHAHAHAHRHDHDHDHGDHRDSHDHRHEHGERAALTPDYSRQMALADVGPAGQARLRAASVLIIGAGGLGVPVMQYLAGAGIGRLGVVDPDELEPSNLHRQTFYALADCGRPKAELAAARVRALNPDVHVEPLVGRVDAHNGAALLARYDVVVDCTDSLAAKFLLNDLAQSLGKPLVLSSVHQYEGQLQVVRPDRASPCLRCIWPETTPDGLVGTCAEAGVLGPVPGVFGTLQALETLKLLLDLDGQLDGDLLVFDLLELRTRRLRARRDAGCPAGSCPRAATALTAARDDAARGTEEDIELRFASLDDARQAGYTIIDVRAVPDFGYSVMEAQRQGSQRCLLVCARGIRSLAATRLLRARGIDHVYSLAGGAEGLEAAIENDAAGTQGLRA